MIKTLCSAAILVGSLAPVSAKASDWGFSLGFNRPSRVIEHRPHVSKVWVPGHYETRIDHVLVSPERHEQQYVPPVYAKEFHRGHTHTVLVKAGYYRNVCIPAQYEDRSVQIWIPGFYREVHGRYDYAHTRPHFGSHVDLHFRK